MYRYDCAIGRDPYPYLRPCADGALVAPEPTLISGLNYPRRSSIKQARPRVCQQHYWPSITQLAERIKRVNDVASNLEAQAVQLNPSANTDLLRRVRWFRHQAQSLAAYPSRRLTADYPRD